jgi:hypothetical protein
MDGAVLGALDLFRVHVSNHCERPKRRPEGGEWEPIKIPHRNLTYIPKLTRIHSTKSRQAIETYNRINNQ